MADHPEIRVEQDLPFQQRQWRVQRTGWASWL